MEVGAIHESAMKLDSYSFLRNFTLFFFNHSVAVLNLQTTWLRSGIKNMLWYSLQTNLLRVSILFGDMWLWSCSLCFRPSCRCSTTSSITRMVLVGHAEKFCCKNFEASQLYLISCYAKLTPSSLPWCCFALLVPLCVIVWTPMKHNSQVFKLFQKSQNICLFWEILAMTLVFVQL